MAIVYQKRFKYVDKIVCRRMPFHAFHIVCARLSRYGYAGLFDKPTRRSTLPPIEILKAAKGTEAMPSGYECAKKLIEAFPRLLEKESGGYADIRKL